MVVYHAITTYHLIQAWVHKLLFHPDEQALFLYDDVMDEKFNNLKMLAELNVFSEVNPIPYRTLPRIKEDLLNRLDEIFGGLGVETADKIYVAGGAVLFFILVDFTSYTVCFLRRSQRQIIKA